MALANYVLTADVSATWPATWSEVVNQAANSPVATPAVPATGVARYHNAGQAVVVKFTGGTVTDISVGGVATGLTSGAVIVPAGSSVTWAGSSAPAWAALPAASGGAGGTAQVSGTAPPGVQAGALPQMLWRKGMIIAMDIATADGAEIQAAIGAGNLRAAVITDLTGRDGISN